MRKFNLKSIKEEFKSKGIFYTQPELAEFMKSLVDIEITDVYDPTCGDGSLLSVFDDNVKKFGQEINDHQLVVANERLKNFQERISSAGVICNTDNSELSVDRFRRLNSVSCR